MRASIGLDMGGTKCMGLLVAADGEVLGAHTVPSPGRDGAAKVLDTLQTVAQELIGHAPSHVHIEAVGVGVPGLITLEGELRFAGHLGGRLELPLADLLPERLGLPVVVDNDNTAATYAEWRAGAAAGFDDVLFVGFGTGIGGGIVAGGRLQRGAHGFAGEIGHIGTDPHGAVCTCGRRGCWELVASGTALGRQGDLAIEQQRWRPLHPVDRPVSGAAVMDAAAAGDGEAAAVVDAFAAHVAGGLVNLAMVLDPACIVLGGGVMTQQHLLLPPAAVHFTRMLGGSAGLRPVPELRAAHFGPQAGAVGSALLALDHVDHLQGRG